MDLFDYLNNKGITYSVKDNSVYVDSDLDLSNINIISLLNKLFINGYLDLRGSQLTELPSNLFVGKSLFLKDSQITRLPDNLLVGESLFLDDTLITKLPNRLSVGKYLDLGNTKLNELPDNLLVGRNLYLDAEKIKNIAYRKFCGKDKCTIFAVFINGEIQINKDGLLSNIKEFELEMDQKYAATEAEKYKQVAKKCVNELIQMRNNN